MTGSGRRSAFSSVRERQAGDGVEPPGIVWRLAWIATSARRRDASTNWTSFKVTRACSGVFVRSRSTAHSSRVGALKISMAGGGAARFQKV